MHTSALSHTYPTLRMDASPVSGGGRRSMQCVCTVQLRSLRAGRGLEEEQKLERQRHNEHHLTHEGPEDTRYGSRNTTHCANWVCCSHSSSFLGESLIFRSATQVGAIPQGEYHA